MASKNIAAFFDFDGTIYKGVIAFDFVKFAFGKRVIKYSEALSLSKFIYYYLLDKFNLAERRIINNRIYQSIKGRNSKELASASEKFFAQNSGKNFYKNVLEIIKWHKSKNHKVIIVTSALREIIGPAKKLLRADDIIATEVETRNGIYTGVIKELPIGDNRIISVRNYCKKHNINMEKSYAYSDHFSDIPLLESLGNAIATNPDKRLLKYAADKGWKIIQ